MKKTAAIFLLLFTFLQATPVISGFISKSYVVFVADEEKDPCKSETEKKEKKDYSLISLSIINLAHKISTAFHQAEKIYPYPCLEKLTPPPNFC